METNMNRCPFEAFGSIMPIMSIPHMENDQDADITFRVLGGALILVNMDGEELPLPVNSDLVKKYYP